MSFLFEEEKKNGKMSFLDVEISPENGKLVTTVYRQLTFSAVYTHFEIFLPSGHKFCMLYTLVYRILFYAQIGQTFIESLSF